MSSAPGKIRVFIANLAWLVSCIPGWIAFRFASNNIRKYQQRILAGILKNNSATRFGREHGFDSIRGPDDFKSVPISEYDDYSEKIDSVKNGDDRVLTHDRVEVLQPTSGSIHATKLIPYTRALMNEFKAGIDPWIASLYLNCPTLLWGRHYWSISPSTPCAADEKCKVRVGYADDSEYLGPLQRRLAQALFAVPPELSRVADHNAFEYLTLLFLCRETNLRMISIWHPSFLTVLLNSLQIYLPLIIQNIESGAIDSGVLIESDLRGRLESQLPASAARAKELAKIDFFKSDWPQSVWPGMRVISCWAGENSEPWLNELGSMFPRVKIQGKGLTATEGIVSFPIGRDGKNVCAIRSHYVEFIGATGGVHHAWELESGKEYSVVLTTGGGLYRYRLHDIVRVSGFYRQAPILEFISRDNLVSDMVGEKLEGRHVETSIRKIETAIGCRFQFAMLAPEQENGRAGYILFVETRAGSEPDYKKIASMLDEELSRNYHYRHARNLGQLGPIRIFKVNGNGADIYRRRMIEKGMKAGDIKLQMLSKDCRWESIFNGNGEWT